MKKLLFIVGFILSAIPAVAVENVNVLNAVRISTNSNTVSLSTTTTYYTYINDNSGSITVDNAGTFAVQATQSGNWSITSSTIGVMDAGGSLTVDGTVSVTGVAAEDSGFSAGGNLFPSGSVRQSTPTIDTSADGDVTPLKSDDYGRVLTQAVLNGDVVGSTGAAVRTIKYAAIAAATSGQNVLVSTVASTKIRVLGLMGVASAATNIYFTSGGSTVIFGGSTNKINLAANGGFVLPANPFGWFETSSGGSLEVNLSAANVFSGGLVYVEVP